MAGIVLSFLALGAVIAGIIIIFIRRRKSSKISKNQGTDEPSTPLASNEYGLCLATKFSCITPQNFVRKIFLPYTSCKLYSPVHFSNINVHVK